MDRITFKLQDEAGNEVTALFVNSYGRTRNGFKHETRLFLDDNGLAEGSARICYLNRTWECYEYQSVMHLCVSDLIEAARGKQRAIWMQAHGYARMSPKRRAAFDAWKDLPDTPRAAYIALLKRLERAISERRGW